MFRNHHYLISYHNTVLYADPVGECLRHAPLGVAQLNLVLELRGNRGRLIMKGNSPSQTRQVSLTQSSSKICIQKERIDFDCHIDAFADDCVGVRAGEQYLAADLDGIVRNNRGWCREWERYRLTNAETLDTLSLLERYPGVSDTSLASVQASEARILCAITFHFDISRLGFLAEVIRSLSEFTVVSMEIAIVTDATRQDDVALLRRLCFEALPGESADIRCYSELPHPFDLTWCHKTIIAEEFARSNHRRYTHFIYLEDDIRFSFANFCYYVEFREILRGTGLLPAFVRVEYRECLGGLVATDASGPVRVPLQPHFNVGNIILINMPNPYNPCFVIDLELAEEYVQSRSFDQEASRAVCPWGVRERAAMGLCFERIPAHFQSRYLVPAYRQTSMVPTFARIAHLPNNYANDPELALRQARDRRVVHWLGISVSEISKKCRIENRLPQFLQRLYHDDRRLIQSI